ncbi:MAG: PEP/pyruvate-binding domain-containing protein [Bdellovibrionota bacterium]
MPELISQAAIDPALGGRKSRNLFELVKLELPVPPFVVIPLDLTFCLLDADGRPAPELLAETVRIVLNRLAAACYAVRSNALREDSPESSFAGQYHTELAVLPEQLPEAIVAVLKDALVKQHGDLSGFSLLIQEYLPAELSGVAFTRAPEGGPEMVIEYSPHARGELVGGEVSPTSVRLFHASARRPDAVLPSIEQLRRIEQHFGHPQDIEWCRYGGRCFFLQSRPITTLTKQCFGGLKSLDAELPHDGPFRFEKTEIAELAPHPTPATFDLLSRIYADGGPVSRAYSRYGIAYRSRPFLTLIAGNLYCDRELELNTLFPAMSFFRGTSSEDKPRVVRLKGAVRTAWNAMKLTTLSLRRAERLCAAVTDALRSNAPAEQGIEVALSHFLSSYEIVFETNLLAEASVKRLQMALEGSPVTLSSLLSGGADSTDGITPPSGLIGNSLALEQVEPFVPSRSTDVARSVTRLEDEPWFRSLSAARRLYLNQLLERSRLLVSLREMGRWLTVQSLSPLRSALGSFASSQGLTYQEALMFTFGEIQMQAIKPETARARFEKWQSQLGFDGPSMLCSDLSPSPRGSSPRGPSPRGSSPRGSSPRGLSPGEATGTLVELANLQSARIGKSCAPILYTRELQPQLVTYFDQISGIVAERGGLLSHLAIMARERGIPVVVVAPGSEEARIVQTALQSTLVAVHICGTTGSIRSLSVG